MSRPVGSLVTTVVPLALAACSYAGLLRPSVLKQVTPPVAGVTTIIAAPTSYAFEATPIVVDGVMFVSGFDSYVWALDATSGRLLWSYHHAVPLDTPLCCGNVNRGVAVATGRVYLGAANGHLVALEVWDYDGISENILFEHEGKKLLGHFDKNGYFFLLDRTNVPFVRSSRKK